MTVWCLAINTFSGNDLTPGMVLSAHRTRKAAERACRAAQPKDPNSYLPCYVFEAQRRFDAGYYPSHDETYSIR